MASITKRLTRVLHLVSSSAEILFLHGPFVFVRRMRWWMSRSKRGYPPMMLAYRYCKGHGIELGAASYNDFQLPESINVAPFSDDPESLSYKDFLIYKEEQIKNAGYYLNIDLPGDATALPVPDDSQDYVLSSHVVEHLPNLVAAFLEWNRVLKSGGIIFMIFPKRDALPNDRKRPVTELAHFVDDYQTEQTIETHPIPAGDRVGGHYHVFTLDRMLALIEWCNQNVELSWKVEHTERTDSKVGNGQTVVCRYMPDG